MKIENNRNLFHILVGLVSSGADAYDHNDADIAALAERIHSLGISTHIKQWFARARTGQVEVNPYWPRGSELAAACFFMDNGNFDITALFAFLESTQSDGVVSDPIGIDDFREWISDFPKALKYIEANPAVEPLWDEYCQIVNDRMAKWGGIVDEATETAQGFFGENAPEMSFAPNLFAAYSTDFVHIGNKVITIAAQPDIESMLHETLHTIVAAYRERIMVFSQEHGLAGFADREKMMEFGYMTDDSAASITHVIEECFVRAVSVVLANKGDERLHLHAEYGCDGVPFIAMHFRNMRPSVKGFAPFIDTVLKNMKDNGSQ